MFRAVPGRCGALRIMLSDLGQEWKEIVVNFDEWMKGDLKKTCVSVLYKTNAVTHALLFYLSAVHQTWLNNMYNIDRIKYLEPLSKYHLNYFLF